MVRYLCQTCDFTYGRCCIIVLYIVHIVVFYIVHIVFVQILLLYFLAGMFGVCLLPFNISLLNTHQELSPSVLLQVAKFQCSETVKSWPLSNMHTQWAQDSIFHYCFCVCVLLHTFVLLFVLLASDPGVFTSHWVGQRGYDVHYTELWFILLSLKLVCFIGASVVWY